MVGPNRGGLSRRDLPEDGWVNVATLGVYPDNTDKTTVINNYIASAPTYQPVKLLFPRGAAANSSSRYRANIVAERSGVQLRGDGWRAHDPGMASWVSAANGALPILTIRTPDNIVATNGTQVMGMQFGPLNHAEGGTRGILISGASQGIFEKIQLRFCDTYGLRLESVGTAEASRNAFRDVFCNHTGIQMAYGPRYVTATTFDRLSIVCIADDPRALDIDGCDVSMVQSYIDCTSRKGARLLNGARILAHDLSIDASGDGTSVIVVELDHNNMVTDSILGNVLIDGLVESLSGATGSFRGSLSKSQILDNAFVEGEIQILDPAETPAQRLGKAYNGTSPHRISVNGGKLLFQSGGNVQFNATGAQFYNPTLGSGPVMAYQFQETAGVYPTGTVRFDSIGFRIQPPTGKINSLEGPTKIGAATSDAVGFYGASGQAKQAVVGSRSSNAALADLLTKLAALGLITDSTS